MRNAVSNDPPLVEDTRSSARSVETLVETPLRASHGSLELETQGANAPPLWSHSTCTTAIDGRQSPDNLL